MADEVHAASRVPVGGGSQGAGQARPRYHPIGIPYEKAWSGALVCFTVVYLSRRITTIWAHIRESLQDDPHGWASTWRNGNTVDPATGIKCMVQEGGNCRGLPGCSLKTTT